MTYSTPELRLVGAAHQVVLGGFDKNRSGEEYEIDAQPLAHLVELEDNW